MSAFKIHDFSLFLDNCPSRVDGTSTAIGLFGDVSQAFFLQLASQCPCLLQ